MLINKRKLYGKMFCSILILRLTSACNMTCDYCYVAEESIGEIKKDSYLSIDNVKKVLEYVESEHPNGLQIIFTGGEPLLCKDMIRQIIDFAEELSIRCFYGIITNGTLLDETFISYAKEKKITFSVSLDHPSQKCNYCRVHDNRQLHDKILKNVECALESGVAVGINAVINEVNAEHICELIDYCVEHKIRDFSLIPISNMGRAKDKLNHSVNNRKMYEIMMKMIRYLCEVNKEHGEVRIYERNIADIVNKIVSHDNHPGCFSSPCGAGTSMLALDVNGDLYPCDQFIGKSSFVICNVEGANVGQAIADSMAIRYVNMDHRKRSATCQACDNEICNGGCAADNVSEYGMEGMTCSSYWCGYYKLLYPAIKKLLLENEDSKEWLMPG